MRSPTRRLIRYRHAMNERRTGSPLPHGYPFLLLDRVTEVRPGVSAEAIRNLARSDPLLDADGCLPKVLLAEAIAQCAGLAVLGLRPGSGGAVLARIDRFRTSRAVIAAGDQLRVQARIQRIFGATVKARGVVRVAGRLRAAAELVLQLTSASIDS
jgi:3-hydroxyacyl-[acyl-carrier-protein] dehydratase